MKKSNAEQVTAIQKLGLGNNQIKRDKVITTRMKIRMIQRWAEDNEKFDTSFIDEMEMIYRQKGFLTPGQKVGVDRIIAKCKIEMED